MRFREQVIGLGFTGYQAGEGGKKQHAPRIMVRADKSVIRVATLAQSAIGNSRIVKILKRPPVIRRSWVHYANVGVIMDSSNPSDPYTFLGER